MALSKPEPRAGLLTTELNENCTVFYDIDWLDVWDMVKCKSLSCPLQLLINAI